MKRKKLWLIDYIGAGFKGTTSKGLSPNFYWNLRESKHIKGTLMQIWKSPYIFVFI